MRVLPAMQDRNQNRPRDVYMDHREKIESLERERIDCSMTHRAWGGCGVAVFPSAFQCINKYCFFAYLIYLALLHVTLALTD